MTCDKLGWWCCCCCCWWLLLLSSSSSSFRKSKFKAHADYLLLESGGQAILEVSATGFFLNFPLRFVVVGIVKTEGYG